jgi:RNA polymerase sigma factor (sigma-70 family)
MESTSAASVFCAQPQAFAPPAGYASVPLRSPATSIILAEAVRRSLEGRRHRRSRAVLGLFRIFLKPGRSPHVAFGDHLSVFFTPGGPLVYGWKESRYGRAPPHPEPFKTSRPALELRVKKETLNGFRVNEGQTTRLGRAVRFRTTQWNLVFNSGDSGSLQHDKALAELCSLYWYPLYTFARYKGFSEDEAQDLTQSFFLHLLEKKALKQVEPHKGRFRSFLLASFQNHLSVRRQHAGAAKRGGGRQLISLDAHPPDERRQFEPAHHLTAETIFDAQWARLLIERVMTQLSEEYRCQGKASYFAQLRGHLNPWSSESSDPYEKAAKELGLSPAGVKTLVFRMRKRFTASLRNEVAKTLLDPADIDVEIHALLEALVAAEGHLA